MTNVKVGQTVKFNVDGLFGYGKVKGFMAAPPLVVNGELLAEHGETLIEVETDDKRFDVYKDVDGGLRFMDYEVMAA